MTRLAPGDAPRGPRLSLWTHVLDAATRWVTVFLICLGAAHILAAHLL